MKWLYLCLFSLLLPFASPAQVIIPGRFSSDITTTLIRNWRVDFETAYCIYKWHYEDNIIVVDSISSPFLGKTDKSVRAYCGSYPTLHTHPSRYCAPSQADIDEIKDFEVIQCDIQGFVFFKRQVLGYSAHNTWVYAGVLSIGLVANGVFRYDVDGGNYPNSWYTEKVAAHFGLSSMLTFAAINTRVNPWIAACMTCGAGVAYEFTQGYINGKDIVANCSGAFLTVLWIKLTK